MDKSSTLLKQNEKVDLDIDIVYAKYCEKDDDWHSRNHVHPFTELFYCVKGRGQFIIEDEKILMEDDDILIVNSNIRHTEIPIEGEDFAYIVIGINGISVLTENSFALGKINDSTTYSDYLGSFVLKESFKNESKDIREILNRIVSEMEEQKTYYKQVSNIYLQLLVLLILRKLKNKSVISNEPDRNRQLEYVKKYMDQHYSRDITLDQLANMTYINKFYLVHEFKKQYGLTPIDYLLNKRIEVSKELLATADYSMEEIALSVGFNSQSYFNQVFKKKTKMTPTQYRKKAKK